MDKAWLQNYDSRVPESLSYPVLPLDHFLLHAAHKFPKRTATIYSAPANGRLAAARLTYAQLNKAVNHFAAGLQQTGVKKGDHVTIALPNSPQFIIAAYATWRIGGIVVCISPTIKPDTLSYILTDSGSETLIISRGLYETVQAVRSKTSLQRVIISRASDFLPWTAVFSTSLSGNQPHVRRLKGASGSSTLSFKHLLREKTARLKLIEVTPPDTAVILYPQHGRYSSARSQPGVTLTHRNLVCSATMLNHWLPLASGQETTLAAIPFYDAYGLTAVLNAGIAHAATLVLIPNPREIAHSLSALAQFHVTFVPGVPRLFDALLQQNEQDKRNLSSIKIALSSKTALPSALRKRFQAATNGRLFNAYGLSETGGLVAMDPWHTIRPTAVGLPLPDTDVQITDTSFGTDALDTGEIGEVVVRGPQVMAGYWQQSKTTAEVLHTGPDGRAGWLFTGDLGYLDTDGFLHITTPRQDPIARGKLRGQR
ncbi:MAG: AMP-binding protein [Chloroflexi bacterium]|nr:AMP-binding protein [Chloroflexota bacterium]